MKTIRLSWRQLLACPAALAGLVTVALVAIVAGAAAATLGVGPQAALSHPAVTPPALAIAGDLTGQALAAASASPMPAAASQGGAAGSSALPATRPATGQPGAGQGANKQGAGQAASAATPSPPPSFQPDYTGQFQHVAFGCSPRVLFNGHVGTQEVNCVVASHDGFSGQISTQCQPWLGPDVVLPIVGVADPATSPHYLTCRAVSVYLPPGGSVAMPFILEVAANAPDGWELSVFVTLLSGGVSLNPGRPYSINVASPRKPAIFNLDCRLVKQVGLTAPVSGTGTPTISFPMGPGLVGNCTVSASDPASMGLTNVHMNAIKAPPLPVSAQSLGVCMGATEAEAQSACNGNANVVLTSGSALVWFIYHVSPPGTKGDAPGAWEFDFGASQSGGQASSQVSFTINADGTVAGF